MRMIRGPCEPCFERPVNLTPSWIDPENYSLAGAAAQRAAAERLAPQRHGRAQE